MDKLTSQFGHLSVSEMQNNKNNAELKTNNRFYNLFGRSFPKREIELSFTRSPTNKRAKKPNTSAVNIALSLNKLGKNANAVLEKTKKDLSCLNSYPVKYKQRVELTTLYWKQLYEVTIGLSATYSKQGSMPDDPQRALLLDLSIDNLRLIRRSYELLFINDYQLPNWRYGKARKQIFDSSFRIMEIVLLEQQISALRYRALATSSWQSLNQIFYVMDTYEHVGFEQVLTHSITRPKETKRYGTLKEFYLRVQLAGYFDLRRYPTPQQRALDEYIKVQTKNVVLCELEDETELDGSKLTVGYKQDHAPKLTQKLPNGQIPGKAIDITKLKSNIASLLRELISTESLQNSSLSKTSGLQTIPRNFTSQLYLMYDRIAGVSATDLPSHTRQALDIVLHCGFKECFELKVDDQRPPEQRRKLAEYLAEKSSFIGEDHTSETKTLWYKLFSDNRSILLQTEETKYSVKMSVGWLTAYSDPNTKGRQHRIAAVSKLERLGNNLINIELRIIAEHAEAVRFIDPNAELENGKRRKNPAFLLGRSGNWRIVLHNSHFTRSLDDIHLVRNGKLIKLSLGRLKFTTHHFSMFELKGAAIEGFELLFREPAKQIA